MFGGNVQEAARSTLTGTRSVAPARAARLALDLLALTKPRVTLMVVLTGLGGAFLAPGHRAAPHLLVTLLALALLVGSANTLNCYVERESDKLMARTRKRPLPAGRLAPGVALTWGLVLAAVALPLLLLGANLLTAALGLFSLVTYAAVYTPLKRVTPLALYVGAVPGALPPLMGFTAITGELGAVGLVAFALLLVWQIPHFLSIAIFRKADYARAGLQALPVVRGDATASHHTLATIACLVLVSACLSWCHAASPRCALFCAALSATWLCYAVAGRRSWSVNVWARRNFLASLAYMLVVVAAWVIDAHH